MHLKSWRIDMTKQEALNSMEILRGYFSDLAKGLENKTIKQRKDYDKRRK